MRRWISAGALLLTIAISPAFGEERQNVVLIVADDHGTDLGCYGNPAIETPNLDRLAEEGTRFTHAFCTTASCSASRSVILTGMHNHRNGQFGHTHSHHDFDTHDWVESLPVLLSRGGYETVSIGKFHVQPKSIYQFDARIGGNPGGGRNPVTMAERCREWLSDRPEKPFFLYFCTNDPHRGGFRNDLPHQPNGFGNGRDYQGVKQTTFKPEEVKVPPFLPDTPTCRAELAQYYQSVARLDQGVGRLVKVLKDTGLYDETVIIYTSDHGIAFPGGKTNLYEPGMRVPMIVRSPEAEQQGVVTDAMVSLRDLTPTILDIANADGPDDYKLYSRSFLGALGKSSPEGWSEVFASHTFHEVTMYYPMRVVRGRRYKLIWNMAHDLPFPFASDLWAAPTWQVQYNKGMDAMYGKRTVRRYIHRPEFELFDLKKDPHETVNLADSPNHRQRLKQLKKKLHAFQKRTDDPWELKWRYE